MHLTTPAEHPRVEDLIHQHGYRKPPKSRTNLVELVFRELESMWAVEIIRGVERVARKNRIGVLVSEFGLHETAAMTIDDTVGRRHGASCQWRNSPKRSGNS
jgi:DNA-binding LacI/PurR family transcriptional regulator